MLSKGSLIMFSLHILLQVTLSVDRDADQISLGALKATPRASQRSLQVREAHVGELEVLRDHVLTRGYELI